MILKQSTGYVRVYLLVQSADHITGLTGASPTVTISKAGAAFGSPVGATTEISSGFYKISLSAADTDTLGDLAFHITAASADPTDFVDEVRAQITDDINLDADGNVEIASNIKKNQQLTGFTFVMTDSTTHQPATGLTVSAQRSLDGAGFAPCANAVSELSNGVYKVTLADTDMNGNTVMLRFTATGADDLDIEIVTQP